MATRGAVGAGRLVAARRTAEVTTPGTPAPGRPSVDDRLEGWQRKLLPLMIGMLVGLTLFFFVASFVQLAYLHGKIWNAPRIDEKAFRVGDGPLNAATRFRVLAALERNAVERRYHQANVLLMSRVWTRYLGFVTGMILALVGATFILGKLREEMTSLEAKGAGASMSVVSASPGLVLAVLGVTLMTVTILTHHDISTTDTAVYMPLAAPADKPALSLSGAPDAGSGDAVTAPP